MITYFCWQIYNKKSLSSIFFQKNIAIYLHFYLTSVTFAAEKGKSFRIMIICRAYTYYYCSLPQTVG